MMNATIPWRYIYIYTGVIIWENISILESKSYWKVLFNPDFESNNTSPLAFFNSAGIACVRGLHLRRRRGEDFKISRPSGNVRLHRKIEGREILDSPPLDGSSSFDELCKRSWRGSRVGQRKWLWRVEEPPPPRKRGKNKRRAVVSSLWMDRCVAGKKKGEKK